MDSALEAQGFVKKGGNIPIQKEKMMNYIIEKLYEYDQYVVKNNNVPQFSPYVHPIIFPIDEEKTVQVPQEIQEEAIAFWTEKKNDLESIHPETEELGEIDLIEDKKKDNNWIYILAVLIFIVILAGIYYSNGDQKLILQV